MQLYTSIFKQSWSITKKHKVLWLFGVFVLFWGGKGVDLELFFSDAKLLGSALSPFRPEFWQTGYWQVLVKLFTANVFTGIGVVCMLIVFGVFLMLVILASQIALIDAFAVYKAATPTDRYTLDHAMKASNKHIVGVFGVNVVSKVVSYGLLAIVSLPLFFAHFATTKVLYTAALFVAVMPLVVVISIITKYALNAVVIDQQSMVNAFKRGWGLFRQNVGVSLECALLSFAAFVATNIGAIIAAAFATVPFMLIGMMVSLALQTSAMLFIYFYIFYSLAVCVTVASSAVFSAWHFGNWTLLYSELTKGNQRSKIHRLFVGEKAPIK